MADKRPKTHERVSFDTLDRYIQQLGLSDAEASKALGYSVATVNNWRREGHAPKVALIAAECLVRRQGPDAKLIKPHDPKIWVLKVTEPDSAAWLELTLEQTKGVQVIFKG